MGGGYSETRNCKSYGGKYENNKEAADCSIDGNGHYPDGM